MDPKSEAPLCGAFAEPSDGLEPSTPSLPSDGNGFPLVQAILGLLAARSFATRCAPSVPYLFHPNRPKTRGLKLDEQS